PARRVVENAGPQADAPALGLEEARDRVQHARLARARAPEEGGDQRVAREARLEPERAQARGYVDVELHACTRRRAARSSHSDSTSARSDSAIEAAHRRQACASPPGTCVRL